MGESGSNMESPKNEDRSRMCNQIFALLIFAFGLAIGIIIGYFALNPNQSTTVPLPEPTRVPQETAGSRQTVTTSAPQTVPVCDNAFKPKTTNKSEDKGIFEVLTSDEMILVRDFLKTRGLITSEVGKVLSLRDNYIQGIDLFLPNKSDAINHLDFGHPSPGRFANVQVRRGNRAVPDLMEYKVGPLGGVMSVQAMYRDGELPFNSRPPDVAEVTAIDEFITRDMMTLRPLLQESFDGAYYKDGGIAMYLLSPTGLDPNERESPFIFVLKVEGTYAGGLLHVLPLSGTIHNPGVDVNTWYTHSYFYLNQGPYSSAADLLSAYRNGTIRKFSFEKGYRKNLFASTFPKQNLDRQREFASRAPPRSYLPSGPRFTIHDHRVTWMGWDFTIIASLFSGPGIHNVHFKGRRIVYENSLSEITLVYASDNAGDGNTIYLDYVFGVGHYTDIIPGVDCPHHATLLDATWFSARRHAPVTSKTICVFESTGEESLWRKRDRFVAGLANNYLTVRTPVTVGNYDYTIDFIFYLDGKMKTNAVSSGYLQASFWNPENPHAGVDKSNNPFGFRIADFVHGAIHDHTFGFKVDLDVYGTENSFDVVHWKAGDVVDALKTQSNVTSKPNYFLYNETRYLEWETLENEVGMKIDMNKPKFWTVVSENHKNKWGVKRGYQIIPSTSAAQVLSESHPVMEAASYTKYHCMVTQHKDEEKRLTGRYDLDRLADPQVSMDRMINGEPIRNTDLVTWVSVGFLHIPTSEDFPMTIGAHTSFILKPFNYFDSTSSFDMPQYVDTRDHSITERPPSAEPCVEEKTIVITAINHLSLDTQSTTYTSTS